MEKGARSDLCCWSLKAIATLEALEIMRKKKELQRLTSSKRCRIEDWENIKER